MLKTPKSHACAMLLLAMQLTLTACGSNPLMPPVSGVPDSLIPPLPKTSRQPVPPSLCAPTCEDGLIKLRESLPPMPVPPARPASSASGTTTR